MAPTDDVDGRRWGAAARLIPPPRIDGRQEVQGAGKQATLPEGSGQEFRRGTEILHRPLQGERHLAQRLPRPCCLGRQLPEQRLLETKQQSNKPQSSTTNDKTSNDNATIHNATDSEHHQEHRLQVGRKVRTGAGQQFPPLGGRCRVPHRRGTAGSLGDLPPRHDQGQARRLLADRCRRPCARRQADGVRRALSPREARRTRHAEQRLVGRLRAPSVWPARQELGGYALPLRPAPAQFAPRCHGLHRRSREDCRHLLTEVQGQHMDGCGRHGTAQR